MKNFKKLTQNIKQSPYEVLIVSSTDYPTTFVHFLN